MIFIKKGPRNITGEGEGSIMDGFVADFAPYDLYFQRFMIAFMTLAVPACLCFYVVRDGLIMKKMESCAFYSFVYGCTSQRAFV